MNRDGRRVPLWSLVLLVLALLLAADATSASTSRVVFLTHTASRELRRSGPNDESSPTGLERRDAQLEGGRIGLRPSRPGKKPEYVAHPASDLVCRPFGECEPCPENELDQPFCLPFGNRRLLHCLPASDAAGLDENGQKDGREPSGEVPAWEGCGKVIRKERQNFWEFVTANILFLIVAGAILWGRTSALASAQYRQLAARIGIPSTTAGWRG